MILYSVSYSEVSLFKVNVFFKKDVLHSLEFPFKIQCQNQRREGRGVAGWAPRKGGWNTKRWLLWPWLWGILKGKGRISKMGDDKLHLDMLYKHNNVNFDWPNLRIHSPSLVHKSSWQLKASIQSTLSITSQCWMKVMQQKLKLIWF